MKLFCFKRYFAKLFQISTLKLEGFSLVMGLPTDLAQVADDFTVQYCLLEQVYFFKRFHFTLLTLQQKVDFEVYLNRL